MAAGKTAEIKCMISGFQIRESYLFYRNRSRRPHTGGTVQGRVPGPSGGEWTACRGGRAPAVPGPGLREAVLRAGGVSGSKTPPRFVSFVSIPVFVVVPFMWVRCRQDETLKCGVKRMGPCGMLQVQNTAAANTWITGLVDQASLLEGLKNIRNL